MKNFIKYSLLLIVLFFNGCKGWDDGIIGTLKVFSPFTIFTTPSESHNLYFSKGKFPVKLEFKYGIYGFSTPSAIIQVQNKEYRFDIPNTKVNEEMKIQASAEEIKQNFSISAARVEKVLKTWDSPSTISCTYCGYCYSMQTVTDSSGNTSTTYGYGNSCSCSGNQNVILRNTEYSKVYQVLFKSKSGKPLAEFQGEGEKYIRSFTLGTTSSCL